MALHRLGSIVHGSYNALPVEGEGVREWGVEDVVREVCQWGWDWRDVAGMGRRALEAP